MNLLRAALVLTASMPGATPALATTYEAVHAALQQRTSAATWDARPPSEGLKITASAAPEDDVGGFADLMLTIDSAKEDQTGGTPLPARFDWRDRGGRSYLPSTALRQGGCGACVSFAVVAALEAQLNIACETPERSFALSRQWLHSCGGATCRGGWKLSTALQFLADSGVPDDGCLQYKASDVACAAACSDAGERSIRSITFERPTTGFIDVPRIKQALLKGPLVANMILFEDLEFYGTGVYQHVTGNQLGSHAIVLVGWVDADKAWIARNSWGEGWGDRGYFKIAWSDTTLPGRYTWLLDVTKAKESGICALPR